jgi:multidrug efflux pump subunit AcrB
MPSTNQQPIPTEPLAPNELGAFGAVVEWLARNHVAANLLMALLLIGGVVAALTIKQEVFPIFQLEVVEISISYPGASPREVEDGIILPLEEELRGLEVVDRIVATAREGRALLRAELAEGVDPNRGLQEVKNAVDRVSFLPEDSERPSVRLQHEQSSVFWLVVYGALSEHQILELAERMRWEMLALPSVSQVEVRSVRNPEILVEIPQGTLRSLGLTLGEVAATIRQSARDVPAGGVQTAAGEILLGTRERRDLASQYGDIVLVSSKGGSDVRLADVATVRDGFQDRRAQNLFNGERGIFISVWETGNEKPLEIARAVREYVEQIQKELPEGVGIRVMRDRAADYGDRLTLLVRNGGIGLFLVMIVLGVFLAPRLAFWVAVGVPTTIIGAILLLPAMGASINMISLFAFIITLGIVVDDAVIVGENVFYRIQRGQSRLDAAIQGSREMIIPILFAVATNIIAFIPLMFVPGETGRFFAPLPAVVIAVFVVSLVEALFILPAHLGHGKEAGAERGLVKHLSEFQRRISEGFDAVTDRYFVPLLEYALHHRFTTLSAMFSVLIIIFAWYYSGRIPYTFQPVITGLRVDAEIETPVGSAFADTVAIADRVEQAGLRAADRFGGRDNVINGRMNVIGRWGENRADVNFYLVEPDERDFTEGEFAKVWREEVGDVPGLKSLYFEWEEGPGSGAGLTVQLSHPNRQVLEAAATELAEQLATFNGVSDIKDGFSAGKQQIDVQLTQEGRALNLSPEYVGRQVRHAFYGAEAVRFQRGRHEVKVMVRLPEEERQSLGDVEELIIRTPHGGEAPLAQVARLRASTSYQEIMRVDAQRVVNVRCNVVPEIVNVNDVRRALEAEVLPQLAADHRGLSYEFAGRQREERRAMDRLRIGLIVSMVAIFALLASLFRSYSQAIIIMLVIPFAVGAALLGHVLLGYDLSVVSVFGMIALSGLVVNGGLVLNQEINRLMARGQSAHDAIINGARRRFRPILLTSLTTFAGLMPMIFETSTQARFLVPMAIALGFGTLFSMPVVLLLPACLRRVAKDLAAPDTVAAPLPASQAGRSRG